MDRESHDPRPRPDWLPRAIVAGLIATVVMSITFFMAYGMARVIAGIPLTERRGAATFELWMHALTNNQVIDLAQASLYAAGAAHLVVGILWATVYAYALEPRLPGDGWLKGVLFSVLPWLLSIVVFLPVVGGGFLGLAIGAGPLPALGNLILHLSYGLSLGVMYSPLGDIPADQFPQTAEPDDPQVMAHYERTAAGGILIGALVGLLVGVVGAVPTAVQSSLLPFALPALALPVVTTLLGATFGGLLGSISGLGSQPTR
ncbi:MAG: hypothetical protein GEU73_03790 [Chloroflexi bacterium]|nr:hypothetical protein [Chloroflexota bacterium]